MNAKINLYYSKCHFKEGISAFDSAKVKQLSVIGSYKV